MKKAVVFAWLVLVSLPVFALETFESQVLKKEETKVYGSGALSTASMEYSIWVANGDVTMKIELPKKAYEVLQVGDVVRISYEKGLFMNEIKKIALVRATSTASQGESP